MTTFPGAPRLLSAGIVLIDPATSAVVRVITLQYNPDSLTRTFQIQNTKGDAGDRAEALRIVDIFRASVIDSTPTTYTIEVSGDPKKIEAIINLLQPLGIKDIVRTGRVAIGREPVRAAAPQATKKVVRE